MFGSSQKQKKYLINRSVLKLILNSWTLVALFAFIADFFSRNRFDSTATAIGIIYLGILGIYVSEKEYLRWKTNFISQFMGEGFIFIWTVVMASFVLISLLIPGTFRIPAEFAVIYTSIIGVFAISQHSKLMKGKNHK